MEAKELNYNGTIIRLLAMYEGVSKPWGDKYEKDTYHILVTINTGHAHFKYYCNSPMHEESDFATALWCYLNDAIAYANAKDIDDFAAEFGYDKPSELLRVYKGCKRAFENAQKFEINIFELSEWLSEKYDL